MKKTMRFLSMALAILLIIQLFPATSLAAKADELRALAQADAAQAAFAPVAYEEVEKRDANTKVFKRKDGSYTAILSPQPLHYEENGAWKEIDNTLERKTVDGRQVLQNRQNAFRVSLPEAVTGKDPVSVTKAGYTLSFTMQEVSGGASASVKQPSRAEKKAAQEAPEAVQEAKLERQSASLVYKDVQPDTDVEYTVLPQSVKENIILQKAPDGDVLYRFQIRAEGLTAVQKEDNSISFEDKAGEAIFLLPAPFLYDASHAVSTDVAVSLSGKNGTYTLTYTPSKEWLAADERVYPVVLDPIVETNVASGIEDSYAVSSGLGAVIPHHLLTTALVEKDAANTYIKFLNSNIWSSKTSILGATLTMYGTNQSSGDTVITAHQVTESWMDKHLIHTTEPAAEEAVLDYATVSSSQPTALTWDITKAVAEWKANSSFNFGIKLQVSNQSASGKAELYTSEYTDAQYRPVFQIEYRETSGKPAQYDYHTQSVGRAGEVSVNDYTRGIYIARDEIGIDGNIMPVSIRRYFSDANVNSLELMVGSTFSPYGNRWLTNYNRLISYNGNDADGNERYRYLDEDGTVRYYIASGEPAENGRVKWIEECPMGVGDTGSALWLPESLTDKADYTKLELENAQGQKLTFDARGRLVKITDDTPNANHITVVYDGASLIKINKIVDGVGREYRFVYDTQQASQGLLTAIECYAADGTAITVSDETGAEIPLKMTYTYSKNLLIYRLASAVYPDGETATYEYNAFMLPSAVNNIDGYRMEYEYDGAGRVSKMTEKAKDPETGGYVTGNVVTVTSQGIYQTTFVDNWGNTEVKHFDRYGRRESLQNTSDSYIGIDYEEYTDDTGSYSIPVQPYVASKQLALPHNLLTNGTMESQVDGKPSAWNGSGLSEADIVVTENLKGQDRFAFRFTNNADREKSITQTVPVNAKPGDQFVLCAWIKTDAAVSSSINSNAKLMLQAMTAENIGSGSTSTTKIMTLPLDCYADGWRFEAALVNIEGYCDEIAVSVRCTDQPNAVCFTNIGLYPFDDSYFGSGKVLRDLFTEGLNAGNDDPKEICPCGLCEVPDCPCRCTDEASCTCAQCKRGTQTITDDNGNIIEVRRTDGVKSIVTSQSFTEDGDSLAAALDADNRLLQYSYHSNGTLSQEVDGRNQPLEYSYNAMRELNRVKKSVSGLSNDSSLQNTYGYTGDRLTSIERNGTTYRIEYDLWGNQKEIRVGEQVLLSNFYGTNGNRDRISAVSFGNGQMVTYRYNDRNCLTGISYDGGDSWCYTYEYSTSGELLQAVDHLSGTTIVNNGADFTLKRSSDGTVLCQFEYNENGEVVETINGASYTYRQLPEQSDSLTGIVTKQTSIASTGLFLSLADKTDALERAQQHSIRVNNADGTQRSSLTYDFGYADYTGQKTGRSISEYTVHVGGQSPVAYRYDYDANGNITKFDTDSENFAHHYVYDEANQLIREGDASKNRVMTYQYDRGGNLVSKQEYSGYTEGQLGTPSKTVSCLYNNTNWKDQLTSYDGKTITYDAMGNPLTYDGKTFTWTAGRQLETLTDPSQGIKVFYTYNADGLRTQQKICPIHTDGTVVEENAIVYDEIWKDSKLVGRTITRPDGSVDRMTFFYDNNGEPDGFSLNGAFYYYWKTLQGDIRYLLDADGNKMLGYQYDAWGNLDTERIAENADLLYECNPFTYRGYQYDTVSGLYYLQSRYYNPEWGRFINADICLDTESGVLGTNLFAYCDNNPVNYVDSTGMFKGQYHYDKTFEVAKRGFTKHYSDVLGEFSKKVDEEYNPVLKFYDPYAQSFHFNINYKNPNLYDSRDLRASEFQDKALSYLTAALSKDRTMNLERAFSYLGRAIHPLQDMIAHSGKWGNMSLDVPMGGASSPLFFFHMPWIDNEKREYLDTGMTIGKAGEYMTGLYCGIITTYIRVIGLLPYVSK